MEYVDKKLENEYSAYHIKFLMSFGKVLMIEILLHNLIDMFLAVWSHEEESLDGLSAFYVFLISAAL